MMHHDMKGHAVKATCPATGCKLFLPAPHISDAVASAPVPEHPLAYESSLEAFEKQERPKIIALQGDSPVISFWADPFFLCSRASYS